MAKDSLSELGPFAVINGSVETLTHIPLEEADPDKLIVGTFMILNSKVYKLNPGLRFNPPVNFRVYTGGIVGRHSKSDKPEANLN